VSARIDTPMPSRGGSVLTESSAPAEVFISYAHEDARLRQQLETHLKLLQRDGLISTWHDQQIGAGTEWRGQIDAHLNSAKVILLLISADFLASDYCYDVEMRRAMERHEARAARVIPVILRPVDNWQQAPFGKLQALPQGGKPITDWRSRDRALAEVATGIRAAIADLGHTRPRPPARNNRQRMLRRVRRAWVEGVLDNSLHGAALQTLGLQERPDAVPNDWNMVVQELNRPGDLLPSDTTIVQVFDNVDGELLILGEPGAGKTTLLLELTRTLLDRAEQYESLPIPVVFPLAPWAAKQQLLADWLVDELNQRYDVPRRIGHEWVTNDQILPLLDGLDEVAAEQRAACVEAINVYRDSRTRMLSSLVVTSRVAEYDSPSARLRLGGAVLVQALRPEQVDAYLASAGQQLAGVQAALKADATLREMAASPLLLSTMTLAYQDAPAAALPASGTIEERRRQLIATYVDQMFKRRATVTRYSNVHTVHWLRSLAATLNNQGQTVFYLDRLQPEWLSSRELRQSYAFIDRAGSAFVVGILGLVLGIVTTLASSMLTGSLRFLIDDLLSGHSIIVWGRLSYALSIGLICGLMAALFGGATGISRRWRTLIRHVIAGWLVIGLGFWLFTVLGIALAMGISYIQTGNRFAEGVGEGLTQALPIATMSMLPFGFAGALVGALSGAPTLRPRRITPVESIGWSTRAAISGVSTALTAGAVLAVSYGLMSALPNTLGSIAMQLYTQSALSLGIQQIGWVVLYWLFLGLFIALSEGLPLGIITALAVGLINGLVGHEAEEKVAPNQGIRRSARMAMLIGLLTAPALAIAGALAGAVAAALHYDPSWQTTSADYGITIGITGGVAFGLVFGGYASLSHGALRIVVWAADMLPLDTLHFLDYATERIFLRRVGGGHIFVHRLLQEYFAGVETPPNVDCVD
jgi:hypothetical protein